MDGNSWFYRIGVGFILFFLNVIPLLYISFFFSFLLLFLLRL